MLLPDIDCVGRNHGLNNEVMQLRHDNGGPCDIGKSGRFVTRIAVLQTQRRNRGAVLAIRHRRRSLSHVLQACRAGIGCNGLLRQQHEAEGAGGKPFAEVKGETHFWMLRAWGHGSKLEDQHLIEVHRFVPNWLPESRGDSLRSRRTAALCAVCQIGAQRRQCHRLLHIPPNRVVELGGEG